jgi:Homospermidine synthase
MDRNQLVDFRGRIVMVGFGSTGQGTLPLLLRHVVGRDRVLVITPEEADLEAARAQGVSALAAALTRANHRALLAPELHAGDLLVNLSVGVSSCDLIALCRERGALYLDTSVEPWHGAYTDTSLAAATRTNYALREAALACAGPASACRLRC